MHISFGGWMREVTGLDLMGALSTATAPRTTRPPPSFDGCNWVAIQYPVHPSVARILPMQIGEKEIPIITCRCNQKEVSFYPFPRQQPPRLDSRPVDQHRHQLNPGPAEFGQKPGKRIAVEQESRTSSNEAEEYSSGEIKARQIRGSSAAAHKLTSRGLTYTYTHIHNVLLNITGARRRSNTIISTHRPHISRVEG
ncbi:hypothetical protein FJTKL_02268 [Diaporthe vaccinii]|uniref:Uncharacterized protein n=1 Tax=Diaporthe vaccinii TaxID=105482 RepID=A0ABR4F3H4_9PEZI